MRKKSVAAGLIALAALVSIAPSHGQVQTYPGPGSGVVTVAGKVDVGNVVEVGASQRGEWKVALANVPEVRVTNTPTVTLAPLPFLKTGGRYEVQWPTGDRDVIRVIQPASGDWVRVETSGKPRWVNLSGARAVEEIP